jgi:hypothetical protein
MLFRGLFIAGQSEIYFGNPEWNIAWLGTVDRRSQPSSFRPENPHALSVTHHPPPPPPRQPDLTAYVNNTDTKAKCHHLKKFDQ